MYFQTAVSGQDVTSHGCILCHLRIHLLMNGTMPDNTSSCLFLLQTGGGGDGGGDDCDQGLVIA